jgi:hypothetical protein
MYVPRRTELGPLILVERGERIVGVVGLGEGCGSLRYEVGAGPLEGGLIVLWRERFSAPLEYATTAASRMSATTVSLRDRRLPRLWGMDRGDGRLVERVVPKKRRRSSSVHLAQSRSCQLTVSSIGP